MTRPELIGIEDLSVSLPAQDGTRQFAVTGVDLSIGEGEIVGLAGESGSGKSMTALAMLRLLPAGARYSGRIHFDGRDLLTLPGRDIARVRGRDIAMVFQDPMTALHPMLTIERQLTEHLRHHRRLSQKAARARAEEYLGLVKIPDPAGALSRYPHQFSGGMRQRIAIASALCCGPRLLIADEPTTALDVTVQAGILRLLGDLRTELGLSVLLITHDLGVMSALCDRVAVMYAGRIVEKGARQTVLSECRHPYTRGLLDALPDPDASDHTLHALPGAPPSAGRTPTGCPFHPRCAWADEPCRAQLPNLAEVAPGHLTACPVDPFAKAAA